MANVRPPFAMLSVAANIDRHKLARDPWLALIDLQYPGAANPTAEQFHVRLARNTDNVMFDAGDGLGPQIYQAFNFELGDFTQSSNGAVPETSIKASNVMRILQTTLKQYGGAVGANLNLYVLSAANPHGEAELALSFTVKQTIPDLKEVTFKLGAANPLRRLFPSAMYRPNYCGWTYNSPALQAFAVANPTWKNPGRFCNYQGFTRTANVIGGERMVEFSSPDGLVPGMQVSGAGIPAGTTIAILVGDNATLSAQATAGGSAVALFCVMPTCDHTLDGAAGCKAHFYNSPMRALAFPGIDSNGTAAASVA